MPDNVSTVIAVAIGWRHRPMPDDVPTVIAITVGRWHRSVREQLRAASISYGADHKRQNNNCADCTTEYYLHYETLSFPAPFFTIQGS